MKITLCGSTRFGKEYAEWNHKLTLAGHVVYTVTVMTKYITVTPEEKEYLDLVHLAKIEESEAIFVIDVDEYIGNSTRREIAWAKIRGKLIFYHSKGGVNVP